HLAARLRDQLEGDQEQRGDDADRQRPAAVTMLGPSLALVAALAAPPAPAVADTVLVARRELARGTVLAAGDVDTVVTAAASPARRDAERPAAGWIVRRLVRAGEPLRAPAVVPPPLVASGSPVT